jgi:dTMP kinase
VFLSFEGIDGCGKTTQLQRLSAELQSRRINFTHTREPGGTSLAELIRDILLHSRKPIEKRAELLLFGAARAQHVEEIVRPALKRGEWVLCDRFIDSSEAYQGGGLGLDRDFIRKMNEIATGNLLPDVTFYFDLDPQIAFQRRKQDDGDRIEARGLGFQKRVQDVYREIATREKDRVYQIDATRTPEAIGDDIVNYLECIDAL